MTKSEKIAKIKKIISEWGSVNSAELQLDSSPCYNSAGENTCALIEQFYVDNVEVVVYVHENEVDSFNVAYEDLDGDTIDEISEIIEGYEKAMSEE